MSVKETGINDVPVEESSSPFEHGYCHQIKRALYPHELPALIPGRVCAIDTDSTPGYLRIRSSSVR